MNIDTCSCLPDSTPLTLVWINHQMSPFPVISHFLHISPNLFGPLFSVDTFSHCVQYLIT